jgi:hypothetical protein
MGMETDRSPVIDPGAPSETNIPQNKYTAFSRAGMQILRGIAAAGRVVLQRRESTHRDQVGGSSPIGVRVHVGAEVRHERPATEGIAARAPLAPRSAGAVLLRVAEKLWSDMPSDRRALGSGSSLPPRLATEGKEDLDWQVLAFDAMAVPGPQLGHGSHEGRAALSASSLRSLSNNAPILRRPVGSFLDHWSIGVGAPALVAVRCCLIDSICCLRTARC